MNTVDGFPGFDPAPDGLQGDAYGDADAEALLGGLNDEQRAAVTTDALPLAIHAGAGSGKTRVLTHRIAWRALTGRDDPRRVLALTFTRKAASELRSRLRLLGMRDQVAAGTFHSVALAQLRTWWRENDRREPELLDRKMGMIRALLPRDHRATAALDVVAEIEWAKARRIRPEAYTTSAEAAGRTPPLPAPTVSRIYGEYEQQKTDRHLVDFDDLLDQCRHALTTDRRFADAQRWRFRHLYVDEFQDVNPLQFDLLAAWLGGRTDLCAVGDPDQAIYGWNGADADHLNRFDAHFPGATVLELRQNYRSTPQVLRVAARALVGREPMAANKDSGPDPTIAGYADERSEATAIAQNIRDRRGPDGRWRDQAVLVRTNAQTEPVVKALHDAGIPVRTRSGSGLLDRADVKAQMNTLGRVNGPLTDHLGDLPDVGGLVAIEDIGLQYVVVDEEVDVTVLIEVDRMSPATGAPGVDVVGEPPAARPVFKRSVAAVSPDRIGVIGVVGPADEVGLVHVQESVAVDVEPRGSRCRRMGGFASTPIVVLAVVEAAGLGHILKRTVAAILEQRVGASVRLVKYEEVQAAVVVVVAPDAAARSNSHRAQPRRVRDVDELATTVFVEHGPGPEEVVVTVAVEIPKGRSSDPGNSSLLDGLQPKDLVRLGNRLGSCWSRFGSSWSRLGSSWSRLERRLGSWSSRLGSWKPPGRFVGLRHQFLYP